MLFYLFHSILTLTSSLGLPNSSAAYLRFSLKVCYLLRPNYLSINSNQHPCRCWRKSSPQYDVAITPFPVYYLGGYLATMGLFRGLRGTWAKLNELTSLHKTIYCFLPRHYFKLAYHFPLKHIQVV